MTKDEIKKNLLATKPSRTYVINEETFEMTDEEFDKAIEAKVEWEYAKFQAREKERIAKEAVEAKLAALGLTLDDLALAMSAKDRPGV